MTTPTPQCNTHLHMCIPVSSLENTESVMSRLDKVNSEIQKYVHDSLILRLNVLYFAAPLSCLTAVNNVSELRDPSKKSLLNTNLTLMDLDTRDVRTYDFLCTTMYGKRFGNEEHLREQIRSFVAANADRRKVIVLDHADRLSPCMQSELREYTGRSTDNVWFVLITYPRQEAKAKDAAAEAGVFLESLQSRLTTQIFREEIQVATRNPNIKVDADYTALSEMYDQVDVKRNNL